METISGEINSTTFKKFIKKAQNDPKLMNTIKTLNQSYMNETSASSDPKTRLREKLAKMKSSRTLADHRIMDIESGISKSEKVIETQITEQKNINDIIKKVAKQKRDKIKKLKRKYGAIGVEQWHSALKTVENNTGDVEHAKNIILLFNSQSKNLIESELNFDTDGSDSDEL
jgi:hypothetical protein